MEVLRFIFGLGIAFSIFGFIWGFMMLLINSIRGNDQKSRQIQDYALRIIKYFLLVSVTANYIFKYQTGDDATLSVTYMVVGVLVLVLYLMGKLQKRVMFSQFSRHPLLARFSTSIDPLVERYLLIGSVVYFIICLQLPAMVDNGVVNWFTNSIVSIYDAPIIGWIFSVIAFFFLVNIIFRGANVIGSLLTGQPLNKPKSGGFGNFQQGAGGSNPFEQFREKQQQDDGFVDYEDVTDEDDGKNDEENRLR